MQGKIAIFTALTLLLFLPAAFANSYEIHLIVSDYIFGPGENVSITGYVRNLSSNATHNTSALVAGANVSVSVLNSTNGTVGSYTFLTDANGSFYSKSSYYPNASAISTPSTAGTYYILANYTQNGTDWTARAAIVVSGTNVDDIFFQLPKVNFYSEENMTIGVKTVQKVGDSFVAVANVSVNFTLRHSNETTISSFSCTTGAAGTCNVSTLAPSSSGTYMLEANNFVGFTNFKVAPFDIEAYMKDSSALTYKNVFSRGEAGFVEIRVSYNSTAPNGTYNATAAIVNSTGAFIQNLSNVILNATNGFVDKLAFTVTSTMPVGFYTVNVSVNKTGGEAANTTTNFQIRDWALTVTKAATNSGFEYGYTAFVNARVFFEVYPVNRTNGTIIENLTNNFTVQLKNGLGVQLANTTVSYNASCSGKACYEFNITMPSAVGDYTLSVALNYSDDYQSAERTLKATDITVLAQPTDSEGSLKELFGTNEFAYVSLTAKNQSTNISVSSAEVASVTYENGTKITYSQGNISNMNLSDTTLQWVYNTSAGRIIIDTPKTGGIYLIEVYVNNKSAAVTARLGVNPYDICTSAKGSADTSTSDYWYQFRTSDTIYFHIKISEAQNTAGRATASNSSGIGGSYGRSSQCSFDTTQRRAINNGTITIEKVLNAQSGKTETLNASSTCTATDSSGGYLCTVQASDGTWDGGRHIVSFSVLGDDNVTSDKETGFFEARAFYIYGYSYNWANKATSTINLTINAYEAGSGWWNSGSGLSGTAVVDSINYYGGGAGDWIWPPIKYDYNVTGLNITISGGSGTVSLPANRSSKGQWDSGQYSAVLKVTVNDQVDYGEAWFSIRSWDAYASPVEVRNNSFDSTNSINSRQNATLYVKITEAGDYNDYSGGRAIGGNVTISVKKIVDYSQYPATEMPAANFTATSITVNASSPWYSSANVASHGKYLINISPTSGQWESGYYSVIINVNNSESGYGYFNVITFYINTQPTNANGSGWVYNSLGDGPVYFNVTTTQSQKSSYSATDRVNTTITDAVLRIWDSSTQSQREFRYPTHFNITPLQVNGSAIIAVNYTNGTWPSGYYNGEIKMRLNSDNSTSKGWIWFAVQPFRVTSSTNSYNVGTRENVTINITINHPDWYNNSVLNGNYTIVSVKDTTWSSGVYRTTSLNYSFTNTTGLFTNSTTLTINPINGKWSPGYRSGTIIVRNNNTNSTQDAWFSFRVASFTDAVNRISAVNIGPSDNVSVNITLSAPAGGSATGNLSSAFYYSWPSNTQYRFVIGNCDSNTSTTCFINRSANVTILPPSGGWREGYNYIYFKYVEPDDGTAVTESYNSVYFYVRQPLSGYMYAVGSNSYWQYDFGEQENVTMFLYGLQNLSGQDIAVNVTNVQTAKTSSNCWSDSCRSYQNATWQAVTFGNGTYTPNSSTMLNRSGYVRINASGGSWDKGDYAVKVFVTKVGSTETGVIKDATFRVKDKRATVINITSPTMEQVINATSFWVNATTSERATCYISIYDYGQYDRQFCGNNTNGTQLAACNTTRYNNATTSYAAWANKWYNQYGSALYTDSETHYYRHTDLANMPVPQNYTVHVGCYDEDWNWATNATTFYLTGRGNLTNTSSGGSGTATNITITSPTNSTYNSTTIQLNYTISNRSIVSACWYSLDGSASILVAGCSNTTFTGTNGIHYLIMHANLTNGTTISSSTVFFTVTLATINLTSPTNTTYNTTNISLNYGVGNTTPISTCWYKLDTGSNVTLTGCTNITFTAAEGWHNITAYAINTTNGTVLFSSTRFFTVNTNPVTITISLPQNNTHNYSDNHVLSYIITNTTQINSCWYRLNNNSNITLPSCQSNAALFNATEGYNNITLYANVSNGTVYNSTRFFTVDFTNITISVQAPTNATYNASSVVLNYTIGNRSALSKCWYRIGVITRSLENCTNTTVADDGAGIYNITVFANNSANATFNSSVIYFTIANSSALTISVLSPTNTTYNSTNITLNFTINGTASACWYKKNDLVTGFNITNCTPAAFIFDEGWNFLNVYANNSAGTTFNSSRVYFTVRTENLTINITSPTNTTYNTNNITLGYTINGTASACWYRLNNSNVTLSGCQGATTTFLAAEGYNNITIYANNSTGGTFSSATRFFTVNTSTGPNLTINVLSPANTTYNSTNIFLNFTINGTASMCWYKKNDLVTGFNITNCTPATFTFDEGFNSLDGIFANNSAGTTFNSSRVNFTIDTTAPNINFLGATANNTTSTVNFTFINVTLGEPGIAKLEFNGTNYTMTSWGSINGWYRNHTVNASGNYTFRVFANDSLNNTGLSASRWVFFNLT